MQSEMINELATALAKAQAIVSAALKESENPGFKSNGKPIKYASLNAVWEAARKPLTDNGLSVIQMPTDVGDGRVGLTTTLLHSSGQYISSTVSTRLVKDDAQGVGSALTYLRRYALASFVGIVADEDDDGNAASQGASYQQRQQPQQNQQQRAQLPTEKANNAPKTPAEAERRFFDKFKIDLAEFAQCPPADLNWGDVCAYLDKPKNTSKPTTVEGWYEVANEMINAQQVAA